MDRKKEHTTRQQGQRLSSKKFLNVFRGSSRAKVGDTTKKNEYTNGSTKYSFINRHNSENGEISPDVLRKYNGVVQNRGSNSNDHIESRNFLLRVVNENGVAIVEEENSLKSSSCSNINSSDNSLESPCNAVINEMIVATDISSDNSNGLVKNDTFNSQTDVCNCGSYNSNSNYCNNSNNCFDNRIVSNNICNGNIDDNVSSKNFNIGNRNGCVDNSNNMSKNSNGCTSNSDNISNNSNGCTSNSDNISNNINGCTSSSDNIRNNTKNGCMDHSISINNSNNCNGNRNNNGSNIVDRKCDKNSVIRTYLQTIVDCNTGDGKSVLTELKSVDCSSIGKSLNEADEKLDSIPIKETDICETEPYLPSTVPENWSSDIPATIKWLQQQIAELKRQDRTILRQLFELGADIHNVRGPVNSCSFDLDGPHRLGDHLLPEPTSNLGSKMSRAVGRSCSSLVPSSPLRDCGEINSDSINRVSSTCNIELTDSSLDRRPSMVPRGFRPESGVGEGRYRPPVLSRADFLNSCEEFFV